MGKILITGGAGFIGSHLAESLCRGANSKIVLLDNFRRDSLVHAPELKNHSSISIVNGSVQDAATIRQAMSGVSTVFHLAAIAGVSSYYTEPLNTLQTNILGTVNVLEAAVQEKVRQFIYFSTSEVYGSNALCVDEEQNLSIGSPSDSRWVYATSKLAGENFVLRYAEKHGFSAIVIRPFNIYGPRQTGEGAISNFCRAVASKRPMKVYGNGSAIRAWCYIDDLVSALRAILEVHSFEGPRIFNIGNPQEVETTLGLARRICTIAPEATIENTPDQFAEVRVRIPSITRANEILGYTPVVDLNQGLSQTLDWFRQIQAQEAKTHR